MMCRYVSVGVDTNDKMYRYVDGKDEIGEFKFSSVTTNMHNAATQLV